MTMSMRPWKILEGLLREGRAYRGQANVRYAELVKLFEFLQGDPKGDISTWDPRGKDGKPKAAPKPRISGPKLPDRDGGFSDVDFNAVPSVWNRWFPNLQGAIALATTGDIAHPNRTAFIPARGNFGKKTWGVVDKDLTTAPRPGADFRGDEPWAGNARPGDRYDLVMVAELTNIPMNASGMTDISGVPREKKPKVHITRIAWTPAVGDSKARAERLSQLMAGNKVPKLRVRGAGDNRSTGLPDKTPADQSYNPLSGNAAKQGMFQTKGGDVQSYPSPEGQAPSRGLPPKLGTPERDEWEMSRPPEKRSALWKKHKGID